MHEVPLPYEPLLRRIGEIADRVDLDSYVVGGAVRDALLGRKTTDLDFVSIGQGSGIALAKAVAASFGVRTSHVYENFGTAGVHVPHDEETLVLEFVGARKESYSRDSRKPAVEDGTLEDDQRRRDFTVNALAVALNEERFGELIDPFGGLSDMARGCLRTPLDPAETFDDDPLRMIRAARFACQLSFEISPEAVAAMKEKAPRIGIVSQERITEELQKIMAAPVPSVGLRILFDTELLQIIFPELTSLAGVEIQGGQKHKDNFFHTLQVVDNLSEMQRLSGVADEQAEGNALWLRWAALLHDIAKPDTKRFAPGAGWTFHGHEDLGSRKHVPRIFRKLKLPLGEPLRYVQDMVKLHHRPVALVDDEVTDSAVRRLLFDAGEYIDDLMMLVRADITSKNPQRVRKYLDAFDHVERKLQEVEAKDRLRAFQPPVDGNEIMNALGVDEGVAVGILKTWIREAILEGEIPNEHDAAYAYMMVRKDEALRRGALFEEVLKTLDGPERAAMGAIKEAVFWDEIPQDHASAIAYLNGIKTSTLEHA
ncbi:MAG: HD domain-containing protein [Rubricoccaceae bacterium]|nr:HD domain-containing protein [Rubricoccaceae bacterium]